MSLVSVDEKTENNAALEIIRDFFLGKSEKLIKDALEEQTNTFEMHCKARFESISLVRPKYGIDKTLNKILDELCIGGCLIHRSFEQASRNNSTNCYVWENGQLYYIPYAPSKNIVFKNKLTPLKLTIDASDFETILKSLTPHRTPETLYLTPENAKKLIKFNTLAEHEHLTTDDKKDYLNSPNLYIALKKLQEKHPHVTFLVDWIDETKYAPDWWLYSFMAALGITTSASILIYLKEHFASVQTWIERALPYVARFLGNSVYLIRNTPLFSVITTGLPLVKHWYQALIENSLADSPKKISLLFKTLEHGLPVLGYMLCYFAAGAMTVSAASMIIIGAFIDVIEPAYTLYHRARVRKENPLLPPLEYYSKAQNMRTDKLRKLDWRVFGINFGMNLLITASVVAWCISPPSLVMTVSCAVIQWLAAMTKNSWSTSKKNQYLTALQKDLKTNLGKLMNEIQEGKSVYILQKFVRMHKAHKINPVSTHYPDKLFPSNPGSAVSTPGRLFSTRKRDSDKKTLTVYTNEHPGNESTADNTMNFGS